MTSLASAFKHLRKCKPGSDPVKEDQMLALTWKKAVRRFEVDHDYSKLGAGVEKMIQPFDPDKVTLNDHVLSWIGALTFFKEEAIKYQMNRLEQKMKSPEYKVEARVVLPKFETPEGPLLSEPVPDPNELTLDFSLTKVKVEKEDSSKIKAKRTIHFEPSEEPSKENKKIKVEKDDIENGLKKEKGQNLVVERFVGGEVVEQAFVEMESEETLKGPLHSTPISAIEVPKRQLGRLGRRTRSSNRAPEPEKTPADISMPNETVTSKLLPVAKKLCVPTATEKEKIREEPNVEPQPKTAKRSTARNSHISVISIAKQAKIDSQGPETQKKVEIQKKTGYKGILKEKIVDKNNENTPPHKEKRVSFNLESEGDKNDGNKNDGENDADENDGDKKAREKARLEKEIQRLYKGIMEGDAVNVESGIENLAFIRDGEVICDLVENLKAYSKVTGNLIFTPYIETYECEVIAPEELRLAVEKIVNETGNAPTFEEVFDFCGANVSQKYERKEVLEHAMAFYSKLLSDLRVRRQTFLKESLTPIVELIPHVKDEVAEPKETEKNVHVAAIKPDEGKVSRASQTDMSYFRTYSLGVQFEPDDWANYERGETGVRDSDVEDDDLFMNDGMLDF